MSINLTISTLNHNKIIHMIQKAVRNCGLKALTTIPKYRFAQDWSHIYDGIYRFEDNSLGEDLLAIREQALNFAKTKLSPYAAEW